MMRQEVCRFRCISSHLSMCKLHNLLHKPSAEVGMKAVKR